ncbi:hypothetical protein ROZALSC1DRAFT_23365, partial [Rozella allomycis CSF55]
RNGVIEDGQYEIPVASELANDYLNLETHPYMKWLDSKRPLLKVSIKLDSSFLTQNNKIGDFFGWFSNRIPGDSLIEKSGIQKIDSLKNTDSFDLLKFMIPILEALIFIICESEFLKSMIQFLDYKKESTINKEDQFISELCLLVPELTQESKNIVSCGNSLEKNQVSQHIIELSEKDKESLYFLKYDFIKTICSSEVFIVLSLPLQVYSDIKFCEIENVPKEFWKRYYLPGHVVHEVLRDITHTSQEVRLKALSTFKDLLCKIEFDDRYQDREWKQRISLMFFPFATEICQFHAYVIDPANFNESERKLISLIVFHILNNISLNILVDWLYSNDPQHNKLFNFCEILAFANTVFQKILEEKFIASSHSLKSTATEAKKYIEDLFKSNAPGQSLREIRETLKQKSNTCRNILFNTLVTRKHASINSTQTVYNLRNVKREVKLEGWTSYKMCCISINVFLALNKETINDKNDLVIIGRIPINLLSLNQSIDALLVLFDAIKIFIQKCTSLNVSVQNKAISLLYLMLKMNMRITGKNFNKVKIQMTLALYNLKPGTKFSTTLDKLRILAENDPKHISVFFKEEIIQFSDILKQVVKDSVKLDEFANDYYNLADVYYSLANCHVGTPDLRLLTFLDLSLLHEKNSFFCEAAIAKLHCCALIAEYLNRTCAQYTKPKGSKDFTILFPFIDESICFSDELNFEEDGICQNDHFCESNLIAMLESASSLFSQAGMFEVAFEIFKIVLHLYEKNHDNQNLMKTHGLLKDLFENLIKAEKISKRCFGSFYYIHFYCPFYPTLHDKEYIFRQKPFTTLATFCEYIEGYYLNLNNHKVKILKGRKFEESEMDDGCIYLGINYVDPIHKKETHNKYYDYNEFFIDSFIYEVPYTLSGKSHGTISSQYSTVVNIKTLQMVLQGSVRLQVNAGPLEIAKVFLDHTQRDFYPTEKITELQSLFEKFTQVCERAIKLNRMMIKHDQLEYQADLEKGYNELSETLAQYIKSK